MKKIIRFLLAAVTAVSFTAGMVSGAVNEPIGEEISGNLEIAEEYAGAAEDAHEHKWQYDSGNNEITAICKGEGTCPVIRNGIRGMVRLTLMLKKDSQNKDIPKVLMNNVERVSGYWGITYEIGYYKNGSLLETEPPKENGNYKVRAVFGDSNAAYLEMDYTVKHEHVWKYEKVSENKVNAVCQGTVGTCDAAAEGINLTLSSRVNNNTRKKRVAVWLADEDKELLSNNDWGITFQIQYFDSSGRDTGTEAPQTNGTNKARVTFGKSGDTNAPYLEKSYTVTHTHTWKYEKQTDNKVKATCQGKEGICDGGGATGMIFSLDVTKESVYTANSQEKRVKILADGKNVDLEKYGIKYSITYRDYIDGKTGSKIYSEEPQNPGTYYVRASFGTGSSVSMTETFTINPREEFSNANVVMENYRYGDSKAEGPSVTGESSIAAIKYYYYGEENEEPLKVQEGTEKFNSTMLEPGLYYVQAKYTVSGNEYTLYVTGKVLFQVGEYLEKDDRSGVVVRMGDYDLQGKMPTPGLSEKLEENPEVVFYYSEKDQSKEGIEWGMVEPGTGTYYMYAVIEETSNYNAYTTPTKRFTVYPKHKWSSMPGNLASKAKRIKRSCVYCGKTQNIILPQKTVSVVMGKSVNPGSKNCTFALGKSAGASKKYISVAKNGKITTKAKPAYYKSMKSSVPVAVKAGGKTYKMTVKLKIPKPNVQVQCRKVTWGNESGYRFSFVYRIAGANRIKVEMRGETSNIRRHLDKNVKSPKSTSKSYLDLSNGFLKKLNNKAVFKICAYYGSKKSQVVTKTIVVGSGGGSPRSSY